MSKILQIGYVSIGKIDEEYYTAVLVGNKLKNFKLKIKLNYENQDIVRWLTKYSQDSQIKFNVIGLCSLNDAEKLATDLWLNLDIVPHILKTKVKNIKDIEQVCWDTSLCYDENHLVRVKMDVKRRVIPSYLINLIKYQDFFSKQEFENIIELSREFTDKKLSLIFINATANGGGVAHMRHAMIRLYRLLGIDVNWYVLKPNAEIFNITKKKFHNILQGVAPHNCVLEESEKDLYNSWISDNANFFKKIFKDSDVVVIDDPQPSGMIPHIKKINPQAKIFYRSHTQIRADLINTRQTQQFITWKFLWQFIKLADVFISHPISDFVPNTVKKKKLLYLPPSTDPFDGLNKKLKKLDCDYYLSIFQKYLKANEQKSLDTKRPYIVQIARFDPSKGIHDVIESYRKLCRRLLKEGVLSKKLPQLVIAGNGSVDDPEGVAIYEQIRQCASP